MPIIKRFKEKSMKLSKVLALVALPMSLLAYQNVNGCNFNNSFIEQQLSTTQTEQFSNNNLEVTTLIKNMVSNYPELVTQELTKQNKLKVAFTKTRDQKLVQTFKDKILNENNNLTFGAKNASKTIIEFIDYQCAHCRNLTTNLRNTISENSNVKVIVKELPILGEMSENAARAALAANNQGMYLPYQKQLLASSDDFSKTNLSKIAKKLKLNVNKFINDLNSKETTIYLNKNLKLAQNLLINATPTVIISKNDGSDAEIILGDLTKSQIKEILN